MYPSQLSVHNLFQHILHNLCTQSEITPPSPLLPLFSNHCFLSLIIWLFCLPHIYGIILCLFFCTCLMSQVIYICIYILSIHVLICNIFQSLFPLSGWILFNCKYILYFIYPLITMKFGVGSIFWCFCEQWCTDLCMVTPDIIYLSELTQCRSTMSEL